MIGVFTEGIDNYMWIELEDLIISGVTDGAQSLPPNTLIDVRGKSARGLRSLTKELTGTLILLNNPSMSIIPPAEGVIEEITAGRTPTRPVGPGQCAAIMTGAPMPEGADAVVMVEESTRDGDRVVLSPRRPVTPDAGRLLRGREMRAGEALLDPARYTGLCRQFAERGAASARAVAASLTGPSRRRR